MPYGIPKQSEQDELSPPHTPQSSKLAVPPQSPLQSASQSLFVLLCGLFGDEPNQLLAAEDDVEDGAEDEEILVDALVTVVL